MTKEGFLHTMYQKLSQVRKGEQPRQTAGPEAALLAALRTDLQSGPEPAQLTA